MCETPDEHEAQYVHLNSFSLFSFDLNSEGVVSLATYILTWENLVLKLYGSYMLGINQTIQIGQDIFCTVP